MRCHLRRGTARVAASVRRHASSKAEVVPSQQLHNPTALNPLEADSSGSWGSNWRGLGHNNYLGKILNARVYEAARETAPASGRTSLHPSASRVAMSHV